LDKNGLIAKIQESVTHIDNGRKGRNTDGLEHEGRVSYNKGLALRRLIIPYNNNSDYRKTC
jgi:hypothetical protein